MLAHGLNALQHVKKQVKEHLHPHTNQKVVVCLVVYTKVKIQHLIVNLLADFALLSLVHEDTLAIVHL